MRLESVELHRVRMPLVAPFRTSFGTETEREVLLVRVRTEVAEGWGECVAMGEPLYSPEYLDGAADVMRRFLVPAVAARARAHGLRARDVAPACSPVKGHPMAKAALEAAVLDAELRSRGESFGAFLGVQRDRVPCGVSVGIMDTVGELVDAVGRYIDQGYVRIKLKIEPGFDVEPVRAVRERFGDDLLLQVDANAAYDLVDAAHLARLDEFGLLLVEQPLAEDDLRQHAELARLVRTPICLDESIGSAKDAADAITMGACRVVNIKPGRVGGYLEAVRVHDVCRALGVPVWCGGMLETGVGRGANVALAALPGCTLPGDTSASDRYYGRDLTEPFVLDGGHLSVSTEPGLGRDPLPAALAELGIGRETLVLER